MLQSDANDGLVNFYVDDTEVLHHFDMQTLPGTVMGELRAPLTSFFLTDAMISICMVPLQFHPSPLLAPFGCGLQDVACLAS